MKMYLQFALAIAISALAVSGSIAATHEGAMHHQKGMENNGMNMMQGQMKGDPVERAQKYLSELKGKLKLTSEQQPAWQAFSEQVNAQAQNMATKQNNMKSAKSDRSMTTPERVAMMAEMMKARAQAMGAMADAVKKFYGILTAEQKAIFDKTHQAHMSSMHH